MNPGTTAEEEVAHATPAAPISSRPRPIRLTLAEIRRLFNLRDQVKRLIHAAMRWSAYRRGHQGDARRHHVRRRLKIQALAL